MLPILYSFRRCPYAIRARMALAYSGFEVELREVWLRDKPDAMLEASPKGTVPVMVLADGTVLDESIDIIWWAVRQNDPDGWIQEELVEQTHALVDKNDFVFKKNLDKYKYWDRYPEHSKEHYRADCEVFLKKLENLLEKQRFLFSPELTLADVAVFPFIRQFAFADKPWFDQAPYPGLQAWLAFFIESPLFTNVMDKHAFWKES